MDDMSPRWYEWYAFYISAYVSAYVFANVSVYVSVCVSFEMFTNKLKLFLMTFLVERSESLKI